MEYTGTMNLEQLSNELLLNLFEYLQSVHLLRAFYQLNSRFNGLIITHFQNHGLDFQSIPKNDFNTICQQNLPLIADHITALRLSDDDDTPEEIDIFLSNPRAFHRFTQLKSLSLYHISSIETLKKLVKHFAHLQHLTHFDLIDCHVVFQHKTSRYLINRIWRLPKLTHCHLDLHFQYNSDFTIPNIRSKSIEHLWIENIVFDFNDLNRLFRSTPNMRHLIARIDQMPENQQFPFFIESISSLRLIVDHLTSGTINLFKNMPNLTSLTLQTGKHDMNGHRWEQFIIDYLPKLKIFRFWMFFIADTDEEVNEIIDSYRTPFWLIHHQWFIRCHWALTDDKIMVYLHTLPYTFSFYTYAIWNSNPRTKSTCSDENNYLCYNHPTKLIYSRSSLYDSLLGHICFLNIRHLEVSIPYSAQLLFIVPRLDRLTSLDVGSESDIDANIALLQLNDLISKTSRLHSLTIGHWDASIIQDLPLHINISSIHRLRLDLQSYHYLKRDRCFNSEQCTALLRSSWAKQCEVLQIVVNDRSMIDDIINGMPHLKALKVVLQPGRSDDYFPTREDMITWMTSNYSRTYTENLDGTETIRFWIRK
ncbi:unnamed protein product [Rotaria magnacalcarata]|uniref:F-box domain-containing protein n=5 Tax=Rotaria magnacalcarata TaxID=392030 RepID=A0A816VM57_9BILA|nr:unnamed protein product [Rotaria magnacalcarata]